VKTVIITILLVTLPSCLIAQEGEWTAINEGLDDLNVYTIAVDLDDPDVLYAGSDEGFCRSDNHGEDWECTLGNLRVRSIWVSPDDGRILITRGDGTRSDGIWESSNGGDDFEVFRWFMYPSAIAVSPEDEDVMFFGSLQNGVVYTTNGGDNWSEANDGIGGEVHHLNIKVVDDDTYIFAATNQGLYRAVLDDEIDWNEVGPHGLPAYQTAFSFEEESGIFAGTADESDSDGLYYSDNLTNVDEDSWDVMRWGWYVRAVETMPELVVMGSTEIGVLRSEDGGENWTAMNEELDDFDISDLLLVEYDDELIYYLTNLGDGVFYYSLLNEEPPSAFNLLEPVDADTLYQPVVTFRWEESDDPDGDVIYDWWIDNEGEQTSVGEIEDTSVVIDFDELEIELEVSDTPTWWVLAIEDEDTVECNDRFTFLIRSDNLPPSPFNLLIPENEGAVRAEYDTTLIWEQSFDPDPEDEVSYLLHMYSEAPEDPSLTFAVEDTTFMINPSDHFFCGGCLSIYITWWVEAISGGDTVECNDRFGFWAEGSGGVDDHNPNLPVEFIILSIHPNPFNSTTIISYGLPHPGHVSLEAYNTLGQQVKTLFEGYRQPGIYTASFSTTGFSSGLYFVRLNAASQVFTQKVMLVR